MTETADITTCLLVSAPFGGIQVHFELMAREFSESGRIERVETLWLGHEPDSALRRVPGLRSNWMSTSAAATVERLKALRRAGAAPDVLLSNHVNPALLSNPLVRLPPTVLHLDTTPLITATMAEYYLARDERRASVERAKLAVYRQALRRPGGFIALSNLVRRSLVEAYGVSPDRIAVVPYPIDLGFWSRGQASSERDDAFRILFVGADLERKGGDIVLDAARHPAFADCEFHVVTRHGIPDAPDNVVVHLDVAPNSNQLRDLFAAASVFVLPTRADISPNALSESMAMELPIVATDVGAISDLVVDGHNGYVVPPDDVDAFVDRLRALTTSDTLRLEMSRAGRTKAEAEHDREKIIPRYLDVLEWCAAGGGPMEEPATGGRATDGVEAPK